MNQEAKSLLQNGIKMERKFGLNSGTTALNLASVCFSLKRFQKSLSFAQLAISENLLKLKNVTDLQEDLQTKNIGKVLCLSFMACSKALRILGFPMKAVNHLRNAENLLSKLGIDEEDLLHRTIQIQLENADKEERIADKFDVRSLSIGTNHRDSNMGKTTQSSFHRSMEPHKHWDSSNGTIYFYGNEKLLLFRDKDNFDNDKYDSKLSKTADFSKMRFGRGKSKPFRVSSRSPRTHNRSDHKKLRVYRDRYEKTHSGSFNRRHPHSGKRNDPSSPPPKVSLAKGIKLGSDELEDVFLKATGCVIEEPVHERPRSKFTRNSKEINPENGNSYHWESHPKPPNHLDSSQVSLSKIEEIDSEAASKKSKKREEISKEREGKRQEIIHQRRKLLQERKRKKKSSPNVKKTAIEEIENNSEINGTIKTSDYDLQLKKEEEVVKEQKEKASKRLQRELDLQKELEDVEKMKQEIERKKQENAEKAKKLAREKERKRKEELQLKMLKKKLEEIEQSKKAAQLERERMDKIKEKELEEARKQAELTEQKRKSEEGKTNQHNSTVAKRKKQDAQHQSPITGGVLGLMRRRKHQQSNKDIELPKKGKDANQKKVDGSSKGRKQSGSSNGVKKPKSQLYPPKNINIDTEKQYHAMKFINDYSYVSKILLNITDIVSSN